jgi:oligopeptide/dipeptide ABC transporter ATP-binding protein
VFTVGDQIAEVVRVHEKASARSAWARAVEMLAAVGIPDPERHAKEYPHQLSGGMRQRVMIAMALVLKPAVVIADEPTTALDVTIQAQILELLADLQRRLGTAIVLITHDLGVLSSIADRVAVFYAGRVVEAGGRADVLGHPRHPYTRGLLDALPHPDAAAQPLVAIPGAPPAPRAVPPGCAFHPRCRWAEAVSREEVPPLRDVGEGRLLACHVDPFRNDDSSSE